MQHCRAARTYDSVTITQPNRFVLSEDYEVLDARYGQSLEAYKNLQLELDTLEQRVAAMRSSEAVLAASVEDQSGLIERLRSQLSGVLDSLGLLLGTAEKSRTLATALSVVAVRVPNGCAHACTAGRMAADRY